VELPVVTQQEQPELARPAAKEDKGKAVGARILVVDDEPIVRDFVNEVLGAAGYEIVTVEDGSDALERLGREDYDVILIDVKLPGMSGIELYEHAKETAGFPADRLVFITGDVMSTDTMTSILDTGIAYLAKPFSREQLLTTIDQVLGRS
jgi:two-component system NtrC family sensor kinase